MIRSSLVAIQLPLLKGAKNMVRSKGYCGIGRVGVGRGVWQSLSLATDKVERILNIIESLSKAIYDKK